MAPNRYDVRTPRGDSFVSKTFAVVIDGAAVDLDEWTLTAQLRRGSTVVHTWSDAQIVVGQAIISYNGEPLTTSSVRLETPADTTEDWPVGVGSWDWQIENNGETYTIVSGSFRVARDVTR